MFRKSALEKVGGYRVSRDTVRGQDYDLYLRLYAEGLKGYNLQENLVYYYQDKNYYNKISWKNRVGEFKFKYKNFRNLEITKLQYLYILKPILAIIIPKKILTWKQLKRRT